MVNWVGTYLHDEESEPEESVPGGVDGTQNSSNANKLGTGCFGTFDKCVLPNISVRRGWKKPKEGVINFNKIKDATDNFSHANMLGWGSFGPIYKGVLPNGTSIAVKLSEKAELHHIREFENEIATISDLQHPLTVRLLGYCAQHNKLLLVYEYMENKSLKDALFGSGELRMRLNWPARVKICVGIAKGLAFFHEESQKKIIHRDIKPSNILLDKNLNPKISDFRLATPLPPDEDGPIIGSIGYIAPEYMGHGNLTEKVDVYGFGVVTLEIVSGQKIFTLEYSKTDNLLNRACMLQEEGNLVALVDPTLGSDYCQKEAVAILDLALMCTRPGPTLRPKMSVVVKMLEANSDTLTGVIDFNTIKAATQNFSDANKLGMGAFGSVYKGVLPNGTSIAVKQFSAKSEQAIRQFESVIASISDLQHPHIVRLLGYCAQHNQLRLVYEYMENDSVERALFGSEELRMRLNWPARVKICVGIAKGLAFLHEESQKKIMHRDIKPSNILLDKNLNPKISDFGLAIPTPSDECYDDRIIGTFAYMAPEYAVYGLLTEKVDIFSFGVVTLQIVSGQKIFTSESDGWSSDLETDDLETDDLLGRACMLHKEGNLVALVDPTLGSDNCQKEAVAILDLALMCINPTPTLRPKMSEVVKILEANSDTRTLESNLEMENGILGLSQSTQSAGSTSQEQASDATPSRPVSSDEIAKTSNLLGDNDDGDDDNMNLFFLFLFGGLIFLCFVYACKKCLLEVW